jgi:hypothetical protein
MSLLESLGLIINKEKLILNQTQVLTFLAFTINSFTMTLTLPLDKVNNVRSQCYQMLAQISSMLELYRPAIWLASLFTFAGYKLHRSLGNYRLKVVLFPQSRLELQSIF